MARGSQERELEFIETLKADTGKSLDEWMSIIENTGLEPKPNTILKHLKANYDLNHLQANLLSGIYLNDGQPVYNYERLFANLFEGNEQWLPTYEVLKEKVQAEFDDVVFIPTKSYISIEGDKIFACAKITKKAIRYGLDLGDKSFAGRVEKAKSLGAMPNITHMVELTSAEDVDDEVIALTNQAFDRVHG